MTFQEDVPGRVLAGKYELVEKLGQGGMAIVWRARTRGAAGFSRTVAVKRIEGSVRGFEEVIEMFVEEARVGAALQHPNIVQVHDFGVDEQGVHYLVTELVEGIHLGRYLASFREHRLESPWEVVTAIAIEVLRALEGAHGRLDEQGRISPILHRDVTPGNILLADGGRVMLADFGLARAMDRARMTRPNIVKGKLSYLAPELLLGLAPTVKCDLFSLGVVMWEAFAGERLFDSGNDADVVASIRDGKIPLLSMKRSNLPIAVTSAVHRALERDPSYRFDSARQMLDALTSVLRVLPHSVDSRVLAASFAGAKERLTAMAAETRSS
ncbi:MAG TPA: serine/threonine-protein kinase [Polyangiaceae bacterium]|nr:serine/threonine-protein kinase [Polyangiaceae bacterium]